MGACIGKKSFKYLKRKRPQSEVIQAPQPKTQDDASGNKSPSSQSKYFLQKLPVTDDCSINNDDEYRTSKIDQTSIDSEVQIIIDSEFQIMIDKQEIFDETLSKPFPYRFVSVTTAELEDELAKINIENPENDHVENSPDVKCNDTR